MDSEQRKYSPGIISLSNGLMDGDQFGPVRKGAFHLNLTDHFGDAFHHVTCGENLCSETHQLCNGLAISNLFEQLCSNQGDGFGIIELQSAALPPPCNISCRKDHQFFD